jgi:hypothetical protein
MYVAACLAEAASIVLFPDLVPVLVSVAIKQSAAAAAHLDGGTAPPGSKREAIAAAFRFPVVRLPEF